MTNKHYMAFACAALLSACDGGTAIDKTDATANLLALPTIDLGKPARGSDFEVAVKSVEQRNQIGTPGLGPKAGKGETFVVVRYVIKNIGKKPVDGVNLPAVALVDGTGEEYVQDTDATIMASALNTDLQSSGNINPNVSSKQTAVWKVDKTAFDRATWRLKVSLDGGLSGKIDKAMRWPLKSDAPPPLMFGLK